MKTSRQTRTRGPRAGFSLFECLAVIALSTILLALVGYALEIVFLSSRSVQTKTEAADNVARLAAQFRSDLRRGEIELPAGGVGDAAAAVSEFKIIRAGLPAISYTVDAAGLVTRTIVGADGQTQRESYDLPRGSRIRLELTGDALATLWIDRPRPTVGDERQEWQSLPVVAVRKAEDRLLAEQGLTRP